jgi:type IV pilus assembly protein PilY1
MWEFYGDPAAGSTAAEQGGNLGYATTGPVMVRAGSKDKNGRWLAVFASGPTGPIDSTYHQLMGRSDQTLKIFVVDAATGTLVRTIDTGITNSFAGSISNSAIDNDRSFSYKPGFYQDDAIYIGYVQKNGTSTIWNQGGVIRLTTHESVDPNTWTWSYLVKDIGPVTTSVTKLQDRAIGNLWLFFGTGRYYYKSATDIDDAATTRRLFGIQEPCYVASDVKINPACTTERTVSELKDMTSTPTATLGSGDRGWYIDLDPQSGSFAAERLVANPMAVSNGTVYYVTYSPSADVCSFTGNSYIWAVSYKSGGVPSTAAMQGKIMTQQSTGAHAVIGAADFTGSGGRKSGPLKGLSSPDFLVVTNPNPVKKILHVQEK